jgi:hypothetical protein
LMLHSVRPMAPRHRLRGAEWRLLKDAMSILGNYSQMPSS